jgi:tetratricopeptide (TPR) repeat protein
VQSKIRSLAERTGPYKDIDWRYAARSYLVGCLERINNDSEDYARTLYLISSLSRKVNDYKTSLEYLLRFRREIREHELLDDVICEIGYHHLFIDGNWEKAKIKFNEVIEKYPNRNAYDNALWWYGIGSRNAGNFTQAIPAFAKIGVLDTQSRFARWSSSEHEKLTRIVTQEPFAGLTFQSTMSNDDGLFVSTVKPQSFFSKSLLKGDRLLRVCGERVYGVDDLLDASQRSNIKYCGIDFLRGNVLLRYEINRVGHWSVEKAILSEQQIEDIALDSMYH